MPPSLHSPKAVLLSLAIAVTLSISGCSSIPRVIPFGVNVKSIDNESPLDILSIDYKAGASSIVSRNYPQGRLSASFNGSYALGDSITLTWKTSKSELPVVESIPLHRITSQLLTESKIVIFFKEDKPHVYLVNGEYDKTKLKPDGLALCKSLSRYTKAKTIDEKVRNIYCQKTVTKIHPDYIPEIR